MGLLILLKIKLLILILLRLMITSINVKIMIMIIIQHIMTLLIQLLAVTLATPIDVMHLMIII